MASWGYMQSSVIKRSVVIGGHKTSVSLEDAFWRDLKDIAAAQNTTLSGIVTNIKREQKEGNLSSSLRLFVLDSFKSRAGESRQRTMADEGDGKAASH